jgi:uncharacterized membrane protein
VVGLIALVGSFALAALLLAYLAQQARRAEEDAATWGLGVAMSWGFLWVAEKKLAAYWFHDLLSYPAHYPLYLILATVVLCMLTYGLALWMIRRRGKALLLHKRMEEIGQ